MSSRCASTGGPADVASWTDIATALRTALLPRLPGLADIVQGYQPETQGSPDGPHLILSEGAGVDYGWVERAEVWDPDREAYDHIETQQRETTVQVNASVPGLAVGERTPSEWLALARAHLRSDPVLAELRAAGLSILRPRDIRALPIQLDNDRWQTSVSFDVIVRHSDILTLSTPAATSVELIIQRV